MEFADRPIVVGLGEVLWDCFADSRRPGGAPANVAFHAGQLGLRGIVCSRVGADPMGEELTEYLVAHGLSADFVQRDDTHPTGTVTVDSSDPNHPTYVIHENVAWDHLQFTERTEALFQQAAAVCFGTLAQRSADSRETIHRCLAATSDNCLIVYDVNLRQHWRERSWIERSLDGCDIVKLNDDELTLLAEILETGPSDPQGFSEVLQQRHGVDLVCITRGAQGCALVGPTTMVETPGKRVDVIDAVGAGDAFTAALIVARLKQWPLWVAASFANEVGALVASRSGAMPQLAAEFDSLLRHYQPVT